MGLVISVDKKTFENIAQILHAQCYHKINDESVDSVDVLVVQTINDVRFTRYVARSASLSRKLW